MKDYVATHSTPHTLISDQGSAFTSHDFKSFCSKLSINQEFSPVNDHRGTGLVERTIRTIKTRLLAIKNEKQNAFNLNSALKTVVRNLRWDPLKSLRKFPENCRVSLFFLQFNRQPRIANQLKSKLCVTRSSVSDNLYQLPKLVELTAPWDWPSEGDISDTDVPAFVETKSAKNPRAGSSTPAASTARGPSAPTPPPVRTEYIVSDDDTGEKFAVQASAQTPPTIANELVIPPNRQLWQAAAKASGEHAFRPIFEDVTSTSEHTITLRSGKVLRKNTVALGPKVKPTRKNPKTSQGQPKKPTPPPVGWTSESEDESPPTTTAASSTRPTIAFSVASPTPAPPSTAPQPPAPRPDSSPATSESDSESAVHPPVSMAQPSDISISAKMKAGSRSIRPTLDENITNDEAELIFSNEMEEALSRSLTETLPQQMATMEQILQQSPETPNNSSDLQAASRVLQPLGPSLSPSKPQLLKLLAMKAKRPYPKTAAETAFRVSKRKQPKPKPGAPPHPRSPAPGTSTKRPASPLAAPAKRPRQVGVPSVKKTKPARRNPFQRVASDRPLSSRRRFPNIPDGAVPIDVVQERPSSPPASDASP